ncbi:MAG: DUF4115 domain-containing protein [Rhodospirillales bacterium]|nr:DUF4115 domain-containing protein [Rhodospirillales bacterium]
MAIESKDNSQSEKQGVGALLRASRLRIGEDLRDVSHNLRIRRVYLEAIEATRYEDLPGTAYAVGFVRAYSEYLGLDSGEVVRRFKDEYADIENRPDLVFPVPVTERSVPGGAILLLSTIAALMAYGGWYFITEGGNTSAEKVPSLPERLASLLPSKGDKIAEQTAVTEEKVEEETTKASEESNAETADEGTEATETQETVSETISTEEKEEVIETTEPTEAEKDKVEPEVEKVEVESEPVAEQPTPTENTASSQLQDTPPEELAKKLEPVEPVASPEKTPEPVKKPEVVETAPVQEAVPEPETEEVEEEVAETPAPAPVEVKKEPVEKKQEPVIEPPAKPKEEPLSTDGSRILVKAKTASWIQIRDDEENKMLLTRLLRPGDSYRVPNKKGLVLLTSNAGALDIIVDGKSVPSIGDFGAVRRSVVLDPVKLLDGSAVGE